MAHALDSSLDKAQLPGRAACCRRKRCVICLDSSSHSCRWQAGRHAVMSHVSVIYTLAIFAISSTLDIRQSASIRVLSRIAQAIANQIPQIPQTALVLRNHRNRLILRRARDFYRHICLAFIQLAYSFTAFLGMENDYLYVGIWKGKRVRVP